MLQTVTTQLRLSTAQLGTQTGLLICCLFLRVRKHLPGHCLHYGLQQGRRRELTQGQAKPQGDTPVPPLCTLVSKVYSALAYEDLLFLHRLQDITQVPAIRRFSSHPPPRFPRQPGPQSQQLTSTPGKVPFPRIPEPVRVCMLCALCLERLYLLLSLLRLTSIHAPFISHRKRHMLNQQNLEGQGVSISPLKNFFLFFLL